MTDHAVSSSTKLLSICVMGKDDDYAPDFKYRTTTTLNYITRNLAQLGRIDEVEILVTDWGSEVPLAKSLALSAKAAEITRFVYVPPDVIRAVQGGEEAFHTSMAANVGIRRANGEFVLVGAADTLIPRHSLEAMLRVLENSLDLPICAKETFFLCARYHIPWQFVERQPGLDAWDRYLLLSGSELNYDDVSQLAVCSGVGGLLMHRDMWQKARGFDERYGGWGYQDIDMGLRISQIYPWLGLSSLGVNFYHMGHRPVGRRVAAVANPNRLEHNWNVEVNSEGWGLADHTFQEHVSGADCAPETGAVPATSHSAGDDFKRRIDEIVAGLTTASVYEHVVRSIKLFPGNSVHRDDLEALVFLAWHSMRFYPRCYVEFGIRRGYAAAVIADTNPGVEMYGFDEWEGAVPDESDIYGVSWKLRSDFGYRGYVRFLNGSIHTGIARLRESFVGPFCPELVFVRGELLGENLRGQVAELLDCLAPGGALVVTCPEAGTLESLWAEWRKRRPNCVLFLARSRCTGMILADELAAAAAPDGAVVDCGVEASPILEQIAPRKSRRALEALLQPGRYLEFAVRLVVRYARRKWPYMMGPQ